MKHISAGGLDVSRRHMTRANHRVSAKLNEIANGVDISDSECQTRLGESRSDVRQLLAEI
jgi:hypothetical protein